mmetsp:Transcript_136770/g.255487  ORF Transcript_136770/g.255487 Transcript_136770/m.255487 type:complete len:291 (-) Transcript_136770:1306-2178(-)
MCAARLLPWLGLALQPSHTSSVRDQDPAARSSPVNTSAPSCAGHLGFRPPRTSDTNVGPRCNSAVIHPHLGRRGLPSYTVQLRCRSEPPAETRRLLDPSLSQHHRQSCALNPNYIAPLGVPLQQHAEPTTLLCSDPLQCPRHGCSRHSTNTWHQHPPAQRRASSTAQPRPHSAEVHMSHLHTQGQASSALHCRLPQQPFATISLLLCRLQADHHAPSRRVLQGSFVPPPVQALQLLCTIGQPLQGRFRLLRRSSLCAASVPVLSSRQHLRPRPLSGTKASHSSRRSACSP